MPELRPALLGGQPHRPDPAEARRDLRGGPLRLWVELSGENLELATAEITVLAESFGGHRVEDPGLEGLVRWRALELPSERAASDLVQRAALVRRVAQPFEETGGPQVEFRAAALGREERATARFDALGGGPSERRDAVHGAAQAYLASGGRLDLDAPSHRYLLFLGPSERPRIALEGPGPPRAEFDRRRMPSLPFQRPVSLAPRLARAAVNLAGIGPGSRVADPFVGTGALLLEAGLVGARLFGADRDATMVRGAVRNLAAFGLSAESLSVADAADAVRELPWDGLEAVVTDPPYGRASSTGGETTEGLLARVLPAWGRRVVPDGRIVVIGPAGPDPLPAPWQRVVSVADRVHRSLTREFRVYRRPVGPTAGQ